MDTVYSLAVPIIFLGLMYFLIMRPQRKRQSDHQSLVSSLQLGDQVISAGGICGEIKQIDDDTVLLESEGGTTLKLRKHSIVEREANESAPSD